MRRALNRAGIWLATLIFLVPYLAASAPASAACPGTIPTANGQATQSVTVGGSGAGTYRVWSRNYLAAGGAASYYLQINGSCFVVGGSSLVASTWTWVNYMDGSGASLMNVGLTGGTTYTATMTGNTVGLRVARVIFTTDTTCVPSGDGSNCASPAVDTPPTVSLSAPAAGTVSGSVTMNATASDNIGVNSVAFAVDGTVVNTDTTSPYSYAWNSSTVANGSHSLTAIATDTASQTTTSTAVSVTVNNASPDTTPPSVFTMNAIAGATPAQVPITWNATADPAVGGQTTSGLSGYRVLRGGTVIATLGAGVTSYTDSSVTQATSYTYQIQAFDVAGNNRNSTNTQTVTTPASSDTYFPAVSNASFNLHLTGSTTTSLTFAWSQVSDAPNPANAGATVSGTTGYHIYRNNVLVASPSGQATVTYTDSGLTPGTTYNYAISAFDGGGNGSNSSSQVPMQTVFAQDTTAPTTPTSFVVVTRTHNAASLSWSASSDPTVSGQTTSGVAGYNITRNGTALPTTTATTLADSGLTPGTTYTYLIRSIDGSGNLSGAASVQTTTNSAPDTTPPSVPANAQAIPKSAGEVDVTWSASTDTGGSGLAGYNVYRSDLGTTPMNSSLLTTVVYVDTLVSGSHSYNYTVEAVDGAGNANRTGVLSATTPATTDTVSPSVPGNLRVTGTTINSISLAWNASTDNVAVLGYHIMQNGFLVTDTTKTNYIDTGLNPDTTYGYKVVAFDAGGNGSNSPTLSATTAAVPSGFNSNGNVTTETPLANQAQVSTNSREVTVSLPAGTKSANPIVKVEYYVDGKLVYTATTAPFAAKINTRSFKNGTHALVTKTYDKKGGVQTGTQSLTIKNSSSVFGVVGDSFGALVLGISEKLTRSNSKTFWTYLIGFWAALAILFWIPFELVRHILKKRAKKPAVAGAASTGKPTGTPQKPKLTKPDTTMPTEVYLPTAAETPASPTDLPLDK
jgi:chitodextrinase